MILKQIAITEEENDILHDLTLHEIRHAQVYGANADIVPTLRVLLKLYDQFKLFSPPKKLRGQVARREDAEETKQDNPNPKARRPRKGDNETQE